MDSFARLSVNIILELLGMVMNAYVMTVIKGDGPRGEGGSIMMEVDYMSAVY